MFNHNLSPCTCLFCLITFLIGEMYWYCSEISKYQLNKMVHAPAAHPGFKSRKCYSPLDETTVHCKVTSPPFQAFLTVCWYLFILWVGAKHCESKLFFQRTHHNDLARSWPQTSQHRVQLTNHYATTSPIDIVMKRKWKGESLRDALHLLSLPLDNCKVVTWPGIESITSQSTPKVWP